MRKSFEKYIRENSNYFQKKSHFLGYKKYIIGFILGLFFVGTFSYAANVTDGGTIGGLFEYFKNKIENGHPKSNIYRLNGENITDETVTHFEIRNGTIKGGPKGDIGKDTITNWNIKTDTIGETEIANNFKARNSYRSDYALGAGNANTVNDRYTVASLIDSHAVIPTSKAVKDYMDSNGSMELVEKYIGKERYFRKITGGRNRGEYTGTTFNVTCPNGKKLVDCKMQKPKSSYIPSGRFSFTFEALSHSTFNMAYEIGGGYKFIFSRVMM